MDRVKIAEAVAEPTPRRRCCKPHRPPDVSSGAILTLAAACGLIVANIYYAQPLIAEIAQSLGLATGAAGLIVTMSQIGYGAGLLFIVPLGDLVENRRLILISVDAQRGRACLRCFRAVRGVFLACAAVIGLGSVAVQILIPLAAHLAPDATRGRVVGMVSSGLMIGIMMARPVSSFIAAQSSWRVVFGLSAAAMVMLAAVLSRALPTRAPQTKMTYGELMGSMVHLVRATPILRRRAFYQACLFFAFSLFWTTTPLLLAGPHYRPDAERHRAVRARRGFWRHCRADRGRIADRGWGRPATGAAIALVAARDARRRSFPQGSASSLSLLVARRHCDRLRRPGQSGARLPRHFRLAPEARGRAQRRLLVDGVRGRRDRLSARSMGLRARRMGRWRAAIGLVGAADRARAIRRSASRLGRNEGGGNCDAAA